MPKQPRPSRKTNPGVNDGPLTGITKRCSPSAGSTAKAQSWPCNAGIICKPLISSIAAKNIYWYDAAAVAERVLTLDELKQYVDTQVPAPPPLSQQDRDNYVPLPVAANLRNLLGRRLLREGRYDEAPAYFDSVDLQNKAKAYGQLRQEADAAWWPTKRAAALFNAASTARQWGMDILGYEMAPDYATFGGNYSLESRELKVGPLVAEDEVLRQQASAAQPDERYHYRYVATALASRAADNLPHTSQAFAAVLCAAAGWNTSVEEERAFYQRYVKEGPYVDWAENFGHQCPYPDFEKRQQTLCHPGHRCYAFDAAALQETGAGRRYCGDHGDGFAAN